MLEDVKINSGESMHQKGVVKDGYDVKCYDRDDYDTNNYDRDGYDVNDYDGFNKTEENEIIFDQVDNSFKLFI
jgi:hypothetical protein